jgi:hypothetical protein
MNFPLRKSSVWKRLGPPINVIAVAGSGQATITWDAPSSDESITITGYTVRSWPGSITCEWTSGPLACTVTGLASGDLYTFKVTATNSRGTGTASLASNVVMPS